MKGNLSSQENIDQQSRSTEPETHPTSKQTKSTGAVCVLVQEGEWKGPRVQTATLMRSTEFEKTKGGALAEGQVSTCGGMKGEGVLPHAIYKR